MSVAHSATCQVSWPTSFLKFSSLCLVPSHPKSITIIHSAFAWVLGIQTQGLVHARGILRYTGSRWACYGVLSSPVLKTVVLSTQQMNVSVRGKHLRFLHLRSICKRITPSLSPAWPSEFQIQPKLHSKTQSIHNKHTNFKHLLEDWKQLTECLPSMHRTLSVIPAPQKWKWAALKASLCWDTLLCEWVNSGLLSLP